MFFASINPRNVTSAAGDCAAIRSGPARATSAARSNHGASEQPRHPSLRLPAIAARTGVQLQSRQSRSGSHLHENSHATECGDLTLGGSHRPSSDVGAQEPQRSGHVCRPFPSAWIWRPRHRLRVGDGDPYRNIACGDRHASAACIDRDRGADPLRRADGCPRPGGARVDHDLGHQRRDQRRVRSHARAARGTPPRPTVYVQLHSENAPDGNVWGWLLTAEERR